MAFDYPVSSSSPSTYHFLLLWVECDMSPIGHVFEHLVSADGMALKDEGPSGDRVLLEELGDKKHVLKFYTHLLSILTFLM